ncbi:MAG: Asparagine synthetase [glutamine-hydrolyzing] 1 [Candidatus Omnitrophica bacterium]|nr:Asparagine synthetase [glutamine-hydrolyzing] 1 [Candidatus Omnitrophota bacterium]
MCGLAGLYRLDGAPDPRQEGWVRAMTSALSHRGPDADGFEASGNALLGHRRLKIIDLEGGRQPMRGPGGATVAFNGEIYNYTDLRREEEAHGRVFGTRSDTESLLAVLERQGERGLTRLEGMFAFAYHDPSADRLILATDPYGKKPLYWARRGDVLVFASELRALLRCPLVRGDIDREALDQYLFFEYVPAPLTILEGVRKLEAGTYLIAERGQVRAGRYHELFLRPDRSRTPAEWREGFEAGLRQAVRRRLVSDVPLGIFLSGGLDSSSVLAAAAAIEPGRTYKTFTIEFEERDFDESGWARAVARRYRTEHVTEKCSAARMLEEHASILARQDEPLADASFIPTSMLCRLARRHVTVCLSGDGGDELLMGYPTFEAAEWAERLSVLPAPVREMIAAAARALPTAYGNLTPDFKLKQFFRGLAERPPQRDQVWLGSFTPAEVRRLTGGRADAAAPLSALTGGWGEPLKDLQEFYFRYYLQGDILVKVDRASMAHALEVRSPLLDDTLVRYTLEAPTAVLREGGAPKALLRTTAAAGLPEAVKRRPKKGFGIPVAQWIRGPLKSVFAEVLSPERLRKDGHFESAQVESLLRDHWSGKVDNRKKLWTLYAFQKWKESCIG